MAAPPKKADTKDKAQDKGNGVTAGIHQSSRS